MKNKRYLLILPLCALFLFNGKKYDDSVIERIHLNVNICIEGQDCGAVLAESSGSDAGSKVTKLYAGCVACHGLKGRAELGLRLKAERLITSRLPWFNIKIKKKEALKAL